MKFFQNCGFRDLFVYSLILVSSFFFFCPDSTLAQTDSTKASQPQGIICPKCGALNLPDARFCSQCGASLNLRPGSYDDPNRSRFFLLPTAELIPKGLWYFADYEIFFIQFGYAPSNRLQLGMGMTIIPFGGFENQLFTGGFKLALYRSEGRGPNLAAGLNLCYMKDIVNEDEAITPSTAYLAGDIHTDRIVLGGVISKSWSKALSGSSGFWGGIGLAAKVSNRVQFIIEAMGTGVFSSDNGQAITYGIRIHGERISAELAFLRPLDISSGIFMGAPIINYSIYF